MNYKSIWGKEDQATVKLIENLHIRGPWLNLAAGNGRYNNLLLKKVDKLIATDIDETALKKLKDNCSEELKNKLKIQLFDITKKFPFNDKIFDGVFCTGTLHLFPIKTLNIIISEIERILKPKGMVIIDFATNIKRKKTDGSLYKKPKEIDYNTKEAKEFLQKLFKNFKIEIQESKVLPELINEGNIQYTFSCDFLLLNGKKKI